MSFIYIRNNNGPNIDPWATPVVSGNEINGTTSTHAQHIVFSR